MKVTGLLGLVEGIFLDAVGSLGMILTRGRGRVGVPPC